MKTELSNSEWKLMRRLWDHSPSTITELTAALREETGWNVNTTYTLLKRCISKGAIARTDPGFQCHALIPKEAVQAAETDALVGKLFDGAADKLFASLLGRKKLSPEQIQRLRDIVDELE